MIRDERRVSHAQARRTVAAEMLQRSEVGRIGEQAACDHLVAQGYRLVDRNYRTRDGELDVVAAKAGTLVFCEVKTLVQRNRPKLSLAPLDSVHPGKRGQVRRMARIWLAARPRSERYEEIRFDAIGVLLTPSGTLTRLTHVEAAF